MPGTTQKKRTWAACACPVCRFVFRLPKHHDGAGVICPACRYLLRVPKNEQKPGDGRNASNQNITPTPRDKKKASPIAARPMGQAESLSVGGADKSTGGSSSAASSRSSGRRRVRHKKAGAQATPEWEQSSSGSASGSQQGSPAAWIIGGSVAGLGIVAVGAWLVADTMKDGPADTQHSPEHWVPDERTSSAEKVELTPEEKRVNQEIQDSIKTGTNVLVAAEVVVKKFLAAETPGDFSDVVRFPETSMPRIRKWYQSHELEPVEAKQVGYGGRVTVKGNMASLAVQMQDFTIRQIALERTDEGYKVDWESWVSWTEMDWDDLFTKRPTEPQRVLVRCSVDTYYNREFNDDTKWLAVKLINPQSERTLYGYVDRDDPSLMRFVGDLGSGSVAATLEINYPENAEAGNQVIISKHIHNGWVAPANGGQAADRKTPDQTTKSQ